MRDVGKLATSSRQMRRPSAAGSAALSMRVDDRVGNDGAEQLVLDPARRFGRAQRHDADQITKACRRGRARQAAPCSGAPRRHPCRTASARIARRRRSWPASPFGSQPGGGSIGLSAAPRKKSARAGDLAAGRQFAGIAQAARGFQQLARIEIEHRLGVGLVAGARIVAAQHQQVAHAGAPRRSSRSLCSAMRLRSRQVSCRIGSMPCLDQHRRGGDARRDAAARRRRR